MHSPNLQRLLTSLIYFSGLSLQAFEIIFDSFAQGTATCTKVSQDADPLVLRWHRFFRGINDAYDPNFPCGVWESSAANTRNSKNAPCRPEGPVVHSSYEFF